MVFKFSNDEYNFSIEFNFQKESFIYDLKLFKENRLYLNTTDVSQNRISYSEKFNYFTEYLTKNKKELLDKLYIDTIELYSNFQNFDFLIAIFIQIYDKKNLCPLLLTKFKSFNLKLKANINDNKKQYIIFYKYLEKYKDKFQTISTNANNIIEKNSYDPIDFYGIIFCYLNNYQHTLFNELFKKLVNDPEKKTILYEILLTYTYFFKKPIEEKDQFFIDFINYVATNKSYDDFCQKCLYYFKDTGIFFKAIDKNKDIIFSMKDFKPIKTNTLDDFPNKDIYDELDNILNFSENKNKLLLIFENSFWEKFITVFEAPTGENIKYLYRLAKQFRKYLKLIENYYEDKKTVADFSERSQFEYLLDKNIKSFLNNAKDIENIQIISFIMNYNIYYQDEKYIDLRDTKIFDKINLNTLDKEFIDKFRTYKFEQLFKNKIESYLSIFVEKIEKISHFSNILNLINSKELNDKKSKYLFLLNNKYENLIGKPDAFQKEELDDIINSLSKLTYFFYNNEKNIKFLKNKIDKLDKDIKNKIYINLVKEYSDEEIKDLKEYINEKYIVNLKIQNLDEFILYIKEIKEDDYLNLMDKIKENYLINRDYFFKNKNTLNMKLLINIQNNKIFGLYSQDKNIYYQKTIKELKCIYFDIVSAKILIKEYKDFIINNETDIIDRLNLLKLINKSFNPKEFYDELKPKLKKINEINEKLKVIGDSLKLFHGKVKDYQIKQIIKIKEIIENGTIEKYENEDINGLLKEQELVEKINIVKGSKIFKFFYSNSKEIDEENKKFEDSYKKLINFIDKKDNNFDENLRDYIK